MSLSRRSFLKGIAGILASGIAPAAIGSGILMPVRTIVRINKLWNPPGLQRLDPHNVDPLTGEEFTFNVRVGPYSAEEQELFDYFHGTQWSPGHRRLMEAQRALNMHRSLILNRIK